MLVPAVDFLSIQISPIRTLCGMCIRNKCVIGLLVFFSALAGCNHEDYADRIRLDKFVSNLRIATEELKPGDIKKVEMPSIKNSEALIVISGSIYIGSISESGHISKDVATEIKSRHLSEASDETLILLIRRNDVVASARVSKNNLMTTLEPIGNNAKVANSENKYLVINCAPQTTGTATEEDIWNASCCPVADRFE